MRSPALSILSRCTAGLLALVAFLALLWSQRPPIGADLFARKYDVHLSPAVRGHLTLNGKPASGVVVIRELEYGESYIDQTRSDANGEFHFAARRIRSTLPGRPFGGELRVFQQLYVVMESEPKQLWWAHPIGITPNQALSQRLARLHCELSDERALFHVASVEHPDDHHSISTICRWPQDPVTGNRRPWIP